MTDRSQALNQGKLTLPVSSMKLRFALNQFRFHSNSRTTPIQMRGTRQLKNILFAIKRVLFHIKNTSFSIKNILFRIKNILGDIKNIQVRIKNILFSIKRVLFHIENILFCPDNTVSYNRMQGAAYLKVQDVHTLFAQHIIKLYN